MLGPLTDQSPESHPVADDGYDDDSEIDHQTCCDDDVAICGLYVGDLEWVSSDSEVTCQPCVDVMEGRSSWRCPICQETWE